MPPMLWLVVLILLIVGIRAAVKLSRERNNEFRDIAAAPVMAAPRAASERPNVKRLFQQTLMTIGEAESTQRAFASADLERVAREISVRPDAPRSERLLHSLADSVSDWFQIAGQLDDEDLEDLDKQGAQLDPLLHWNDHSPTHPAHVEQLLQQLRTFKMQLEKHPWAQ